MLNLASGHFVRFLNYANLLSALFIVLISIFHYEKIHNVKWKFPKDHSDIQQMINELGLVIE